MEDDNKQEVLCEALPEPSAECAPPMEERCESAEDADMAATDETSGNVTTKPDDNKTPHNPTPVKIVVKPKDCETYTKQSRFHTPTLLDIVKEVEDEADVTITIEISNTEIRELAHGPKATVVGILEKAIIPPEVIPAELRKYVQFIVDHSNVKAVGVHAVLVNENGDNGMGFAVTADDCTVAQAIAFVNCGDANMDEFVAKSGVQIPGRGDKNKGVILPTQEQVESLG